MDALLTAILTWGTDQINRDDENITFEGTPALKLASPLVCDS